MLLDKNEKVLTMSKPEREPIYMTSVQKQVISEVFLRKGWTYHTLVDKAGLEYRPSKFDDLTYNQAKKIIYWINANISSLQ